MGKKCYVFNAGCIRRGLDAIRLKKYLEVNGWKSTGSPRCADLVIIATCGVVKANEKNSLVAIEDALTHKAPDARVIITGCLPNINPEAIRRLGDFAYLPTKDIEKIDQLVPGPISFRNVSPPDSVAEGGSITDYLVARSFVRRSKLYKKLFRKFAMNNVFLMLSVRINKFLRGVATAVTGNRNLRIVPYYNIAIARGCLSNCAFCATKLAIGELTSRPMDQLVDEFRRGLDKGYNVFQLISEDTGCYGLDIGIDFSCLLSVLASFGGKYRINVIDYHPRWLVSQFDRMYPVLVSHQDKIKEMFIPIQSGSESMLRRMMRDHTAGGLKPLLMKLCSDAPKIALRTSIMVGFPGETDECFRETVDFLDGIRFAEVTVNRYEDRPGIASANMDGKVDQEIIENRARYLSEHLGCHILS